MKPIGLFGMNLKSFGVLPDAVVEPSLKPPDCAAGWELPELKLKPCMLKIFLLVGLKSVCC